MPFFDSPGPLVFAHRGGSALGPENTLAAFDLGMAAGADGLELDVHLSADGVVVVHHDDTLDRTTDASGPIAARTAAELAGVDAGCRFMESPIVRQRPIASTCVPTLKDVLGRYPHARIIVEMKVDSEAMARAVVDEIRSAHALDRVCTAGFGLASLRAARASQPLLATSAAALEVQLALYRSWLRWPVRRVAYAGYQVPELAGCRRVVSPRFIRDAHDAGLKVQVWTVDDPDDMRRLLEWGVDGLITNRPDLAVRVRDKFVAERRESSS